MEHLDWDGEAEKAFCVPPRWPPVTSLSECRPSGVHSSALALRP